MGVIGQFRRDDGYARWIKATEWPLVALGLMFLVVLILPLAQPLTFAEQSVIEVANLAIWGLFVVDYVARPYLAPVRGKFVRTHPLDLAVIALPFLRPFRLLRLLAVVITTGRRAGGLAVRRVTVYVVATACIVTSTAAVLVYDQEKDNPGATITTLGDAFWWAIATVTTVGYGDVTPRSGTGRLLAVALMVTGIALIGTITAAVAAWFVNVVRQAATADDDDTAESERLQLLVEIRAVREEVTALRREVETLTPTTYADRPAP